MNRSSIYKKMIVLYLGSFIAWFHGIGVVPLGYIYNTYPGKDTLILTILVLPGISAAIGGLLTGRMIQSMGKKNTVLISMILMMVGGLGMMLLGDKGIGIALACSAIYGFAGGSIPAVNYESLIAIAPENLRDKVCGWSDAVCSFGVAVGLFAAGILAADGVWTRAYAIYLFVIPVFILEVIFLPNDDVVKATEKKRKAQPKDAGKLTEAASNIKAALPPCVIALLIVKLFSGMFYSSFGAFSSDYIINDLQVGTSALVGTVNTAGMVVSIAASAAVFLWLKTFRGFSSILAQLVIGAGLLGLVMAGTSIPGLFLCVGLLNVGMMSSHSSISTIIGLAPDKNAVGKAAGILMAVVFVGESTCAYVVRPIAGLILGNSSAANCMKVSGIISVIIGVISLPFFVKAYKLAYNKKERSYE